MDRRRDLAVLAAVAVGWLVLARLLARYGALAVPQALALGLQGYLSLVLIIATAIGLSASFALVPDPKEALGIRHRLSHEVAGVLAGPVVVALSSYLAFELALPTLIEEIRRGGRQAAQANTGEFGRAIAESHVAVTLVWAVLLTPIAEELIFRGALWSAIRDVTARLMPRFRWLREGGIATLITAAVFTALHADQAGGAGIVRVVQAACLGLALGVARHASGSIWPAMLLHASFNLVSLAKLRKWIVTPGWPPPLPIPTWQWQLGAGCAALLGAWWLHRWPRLRRVQAGAAIYVARPRHAVFEVVIAPETIPAVFHGHGPIPATVEATMVDGPMRPGALRRVTQSDGSVIDEMIVALEPPSLQEYRLVKGFRFPLSLMVKSAGGRWQLDDEGDGTQIDWRFHFELHSAWLWPVAKLMARPFRIAMQRALERIRTLCEEPRA